MQVYSDGNLTPFVKGVVKEVVPIWDHGQGERDAIFVGLKLTLMRCEFHMRNFRPLSNDGRTEVVIDMVEVDLITQVAAYRR